MAESLYSGRGAGGRFNSSFTGEAEVFGVGNLKFLDSEAGRVAAYWRAQEYGTTALVGRALGGAWGGIGGGRGARDRSREAISPFGTGNGQQFIPFHHTMDIEGALKSAYAARWVMSGRSEEAADHHWAHKVYAPVTFTRNTRDGKGFGRHRRNPTSDKPTLGIISKPIEAKSVYAKGAAEFDLPGRETAVLRELLDEMFQAGRTSTSSRSIASFPEMLGIRTTSDIGQQALRSAAGNFRSNLRRVHRALAAELADTIAAQLEIKRPGVSTGALRATITDPRNRIPG